MSHKLDHRFGIKFRIGIGSVRPIASVSESYSEAIAVLVRSEERVAHADDVSVSCEYDESYPLQYEKRLFAAVEAGQVESATDEATRFFDWMNNSLIKSITSLPIPLCADDFRVPNRPILTAG
jgi:two-component system response regulator YesN